MLVFADARVWHVGDGIVHLRDRLVPLFIERPMIELQAPVRQLSETEFEIFVDRPGVDDVTRDDLVADVPEIDPVRTSINGLSSIRLNISCNRDSASPGGCRRNSGRPYWSGSGSGRSPLVELGRVQTPSLAGVALEE